MNEVDTHTTDENCNLCGSTVVSEYGRYRCGNRSCSASSHGSDISYDASDDEISEWKNEDNHLFLVQSDDGKVVVEASSWKVEDGVLIFYDDRSEATISGRKQKKSAFKKWSNVSEMGAE